jgi:hypothetical protein
MPSVYRSYFDFFCIVFFLYIVKVPPALLLPCDVYIYFFSFHYGTYTMVNVMNPDIIMREMSMKFNLALLACTKETTFYVYFYAIQYFSVLAESIY